ncbi:GNAT family N-acetyltransferase [Streptacidiphilus sp. MAP12-33]|uniref:GNAT family N-acetyltransferase n=1 Tax=Streptacidiphilus sp. MAP12-33 TaxID=3156266 RepID=UPI0035175E44
MAGWDPTLQWIWDTWGTPDSLARSGCAWGAWGAWGAFEADRLVSVACTYLRGRDHEDIAVATAPAHRRRGLAAVLAVRLAADVRARGRDATWTAPTSNTGSLALAMALGFRAVRTQTAYWVGGSRNPALPPADCGRQGRVKTTAASV